MRGAGATSRGRRRLALGSALGKRTALVDRLKFVLDKWDDEVDVGGGIKGRVTAVTIFSTYIQTEDGLMKIVPNDNIWKSVIVNQTTGTVSTPAAAAATAVEAKPLAG